MGPRSAALSYVPYGDLAGAPNVVVDGSPTEGTVLCLSHWPGIAGPAEFRADTSAEMAFLYVAAGAFDRHGGAAAVSNNHFDQDGLVSVFALSEPEEALARRAVLVDVARSGDFATYSSREAARISMAIAAFATPERSPLDGLAEMDNYDDIAARLYTEVLGRLSELCDHPDRYRHLWEEEDATLAASEAAVRSGAVSIDEVPRLDLAVVSVPDGSVGAGAGGHRFAGAWVAGVHPMALHNATACGALLVTRGQHFEFTYRYESWVQYHSRTVRPRVDLAPLAELLNAEEPGAGTWVAGGAWELTPTVTLQGAEESAMAATRFRALVEAHLAHAPPAWDPYDITS
jgi:hypothetical protein